ncbi:MAG TPA: ATP-binding protein [Vicinamibacterales bacterium]|nr:ATP-binding protein [Vicinamibacterales bacterium]
MFRTSATDAPQAAPAPRRRLLDNPRIVTLIVLLLAAVMGGLFWLSGRSADIETRVLTDVVLYALLSLNMALIIALVFVLARNLVKLWVEQRQAAPFSRFRAKLVGALLAMSIVPAVLVLFSGSEILRNSAARWFSEPVDTLLKGAKDIASQYYTEQSAVLGLRADRLARTVPPAAVTGADEAALNSVLKDELFTMIDGTIEMYRAVPGSAGATDAALVTASESPTLSGESVRASADRLASRSIATGKPETAEEGLDNNGVLLRAVAPILGPDRRPIGAVVVSRHLGPEFDREATRASQAFEKYKGMELLKEPILGSYLSIFLTATLLILIAATWLGLYLAKRITRPVQQLAEGARAIGAGRLDVRLEAETGDELGSLVEAFNMMAAELQTNRAKLDQSRVDLERKNAEVDGRRRYIETVLERVATGVISLDASGRISTMNGAAQRLLGVDAGSLGQPARAVLEREDLRPLLPLVDAVEARTGRAVVQEVSLVREGRETNLATAATVLGGDGSEGAVMVLDDVTPLIRAQRVAAWRDVARRLAHEIKNPLTPIQLSAERLRRHFAAAPAPTQSLVGECTDAIIAEVESLKGLVDEFAQFARLRGPRMMPADLNALVDESLKLYAGVLQQGTLRIERQLASALPPVRLDSEQIRQVIINLVDNAMEALGGPNAATRPNGERPLIVVLTLHDVRNSLVRLVISDNGPGVPESDRDKLFMPYYSTKGRGSGLGLAIVRRIVVEHGGGIEVSGAQPTGTTFTVELPAA